MQLSKAVTTAPKPLRREGQPKHGCFQRGKAGAGAELLGTANPKALRATVRFEGKGFNGFVIAGNVRMHAFTSCIGTRRKT